VGDGGNGVGGNGWGDKRAVTGGVAMDMGIFVSWKEGNRTVPTGKKDEKKPKPKELEDSIIKDEKK